MTKLHIIRATTLNSVYIYPCLILSMSVCVSVCECGCMCCVCEYVCVSVSVCACSYPLIEFHYCNRYIFVNSNIAAMFLRKQQSTMHNVAHVCSVGKIICS